MSPFGKKYSHAFWNLFPADQYEAGKSKRSTASSIEYAPLETRRLLAFSGNFNAGSSTLTLDQTQDDGTIVVAKDASNFIVTDSKGTFSFSDADNLSIILLSDTSNRLDLNLDAVHVGDVDFTTQRRRKGRSVWRHGQSSRW